MVRVGLVGEDPNDTSSVKNLLENRYKDRVHFFPLLKGTKGFQLDNPKVKRSLPIEFESKNCRFVVYVRDLDAFKSQGDKFTAKLRWFKELDAAVNGKGILMLNIWELEALILGDMATFNKMYGTDHQSTHNPMLVKEPKEVLIKLTHKSRKPYKESHCPEIFKQLDIDKVIDNCSCFKEFITEFDSRL